MSEPKRPRLELSLPRLKFESRMCFVRHFARCYQRNPGSIRVQKDNLLKATLLNKSTTNIIRSLLRNFWLQNKIGSEFELQLDRGSGATLRFSDSITFALLDLVKPQGYRICGHFGDFGNYKRINPLIELSKYSNELVAFKPTHEDNFILLLQSMQQHLDYLECDSKFLSFGDVPVLRIKHFKSTPSPIPVPLRDLLRHRIKCLDLRNDISGACIVDDDCPTQNALRKLIVKGNMNSVHEAFSYFQDVNVFAPNLTEYEIEFKDQISNDQMQLAACNFSGLVWSKYFSLKSLIDNCKDQMESLTVKVTVSAEISSNKIEYETDWVVNLQRLCKNLNFNTHSESDPYGKNEIVEIHRNEGFLKLDFKAKLTLLLAPEWTDDLLFQRVNT